MDEGRVEPPKIRKVPKNRPKKRFVHMKRGKIIARTRVAKNWEMATQIPPAEMRDRLPTAFSLAQW